MAKDAVTFIRALGLAKVDLLGFSMGGMIAQVIVQDEPQLVRKLILAGTGPAGGPIGGCGADAGDMAAYLRANHLTVVCDRNTITITSQPTTGLSPALKQRPPPDPSWT